MEMTKEVWEKYHAENYLENLSDYSLDDIRNRMVLSELLEPGKTVLYVGVGTGSALKQLDELGCVVHSLDIAENARDKAELYSQFWLESDFGNISSTRNKPTIETMVEKNGGIVVLHVDEMEYSQYGIGWRTIHVKSRQS